jgi:hypothetical protein
VNFFIQGSHALQPGLLRPDRWKVARYETRSVGAAMVRYAGSLVPFWVAIFTRIGRTAAIRWMYRKAHLRLGALAPSVVVDRDTGVVASFTDLDATSSQPVPVIKLKHERLDLMPESAREPGTRLVSVCVYEETEESMSAGRWSDFDPVTAESVVRDAAACERTKARLSTANWQALELGMAQLQGVRAPGIYAVNLPVELVEACIDLEADHAARAKLTGPNEYRSAGRRYAPEFKGWIARDCSEFSVWFWVTLEDNGAEFFYAPMVLLVLASILAGVGVLPLPAVIFLAGLPPLVLGLVVRAVQSWKFVEHGVPVLGEIGPSPSAKTRFRKWEEHLVHFEHEGEARAVKHVFLKKEARDGEQVLILVDERNPKRIRVVKPAKDREPAEAE